VQTTTTTTIAPTTTARKTVAVLTMTRYSYSNNDGRKKPSCKIAGCS